MNRTKKKIKLSRKMQINFASSVAAERMENREETTNGTCEKYVHVTDKTGGGKH